MGGWVLEFDAFELDQRGEELRCEGLPVTLNRRPFQVLAYLLRHPDRFVSKDELIREVWGGVAVSDSALATALKEVRHALRDDGRQQRIIRTSRGRGFRVVVPVQAHAREVDAPAGPGDVAVVPAERERRAADPDPAAGGEPLFVGREDLLARLHEAVDESLAGRGGSIFLSGDAGIGCSSLAERAVAYARRRGVRVVSSRCSRRQGAPPFSPWIQLFRGLAASAGAGSRALQARFDAVLRRDAAPPGSEGLDPSLERFRLLDGATHALLEVVGRAPLLIVLEDLHWADPSSVHLLQHLAGRLSLVPLVVIATLRDTELADDHPLHEWLASAAAERSCERLSLGPLARPEIDRFLTERLGGAPPPGLAEMLAERSQGNPLFLSELTSWLLEEGIGVAGGEGTVPELPVPPRLQELVQQRLARLSPACVELLEVVSVIGRRADREVVERVRSVAPQDFARALDEARHGGILLAAAEPDRSCEFSHWIVQEGVYGGLGEQRRRQLHRAVAVMLEDRFTEAGPHETAELAHHLHQAGSLDELDRSVAFAIAAAEQAIEALGYAEATTQLQRALDILEKTELGNRSRLGEVLFLLAEVRTLAGSAREGLATFRRAAELARERGSAQDFARAALGMERARQLLGDRSGETVALLTEALVAVGSELPILRAQILTALPDAIRASLSKHLFAQLGPLSEQGLAAARDASDPETLAVALLHRSEGLIHEHDPRVRVAVADELVSVVEGAGLARFVPAAHQARMLAHLEIGDARAAEQDRARLLEAEGDAGDPWLAAEKLNGSILHALQVGCFEQAERQIAERLAIARRTKSGLVLRGTWGQLFALRREQARLGELEGVVRDSARELRSNPVWHPALAILYWETGRHAEARREFASFAAESLEAETRWNFLIIMSMAAVLCSHLRDILRASAYYGLLLPYAEMHCVYPTLYSGSASRYLGLLSATLGRWEQAERHFRVALEMHRSLGARPFEVWTRIELAEMLGATGSAGERTRALPLAEDALARATELGMSAACRRARSFLERADAAASARSSHR